MMMMAEVWDSIIFHKVTPVLIILFINFQGEELIMPCAAQTFILIIEAWTSCCCIMNEFNMFRYK